MRIVFQHDKQNQTTKAKIVQQQNEQQQQSNQENQTSSNQI